MNWSSISSVREALILRVGGGAVIGLIIGIMLARLEKLPQAVLPLTATVVATLGLVVFALWAGAGVMRRKNLILWLCIATPALALLTHYNIRVESVRGYPVGTFFLWPALVFIAHELVSSADISGKRIAPYPTYFNEAWKRGIQLIAALIFTGLFWAILSLGGVLLGLIGLKWLGKLLTQEWFYAPVTGIALGAGFHLTDVNVRLLASLRALVLNVLSWLLPVMVVIGVLFVGGLAVKGLEPLWQTRAATMTLVSGCVFFVLLINAAYQQGEDDEGRTIWPVLKIAARVASGLLLIFAVLAVYSLWLRINQYGLTSQRVLAAMAVVISLLFGLGYAAAAVRLKGRWMEGIEAVNVGMAFVKVIVFITVLSPFADPRRLSVDDQVGRLTANKVSVEQFDWALLAHETGVYGRNALVKLSKSENADVATKAADVLKNGAFRSYTPPPPVKAADLRQLKVVYPVGAALPEGFAHANWSQVFSHDCLRDAARLNDCFAVVKDIDGDGKVEVLLATMEAGGDSAYVTVAYQRDGQWHTAGFLGLTGPSLEAFRKGDLTIKNVPTYQITIEDQSMQVTLSKAATSK